MKVRVVILLSKEVGRYVAGLARKAGKVARSQFVLDNQKFTPHITICKVETKENNLEKLGDVLSEFFSHFKEFNLYSKSIAIANEGIGSTPADAHAIYLDLKSSAKLKDLRKATIQVAKKYNLKQEYAKLLPFRPHLTLVRFENLKGAKLGKEKLKMEPLDFRVDTVALTNSVEYGQVSKIIKKFKLSAR